MQKTIFLLQLKPISKRILTTISRPNTINSLIILIFSMLYDLRPPSYIYNVDIRSFFHPRFPVSLGIRLSMKKQINDVTKYYLELLAICLRQYTICKNCLQKNCNSLMIFSHVENVKINRLLSRFLNTRQTL